MVNTCWPYIFIPNAIRNFKGPGFLQSAFYSITRDILIKDICAFDWVTILHITIAEH
jgi:hypothetical protein